MAFTRGQLGPLTRPGLFRDFRDSYEELDPQWNGFLRDGSLERAERERAVVAGLPRHPSVGELERTPLINPKVSPLRRYTDTEYKGGFAVSRRAMEDDLYDRASQSSRWVGRSVRLTQEEEAAALLDDAFAGSEFLGLQGEAMISASHTFVNAAGTWSNRLTGDPQLNVASMQAAWEMAELVVDHTNNPISLNFSRLVIRVKDKPTAIQLTRSVNEPFTSDNNLNDNTARGDLDFVVTRFANQSNRNWFFVDPTNNDFWLEFRVQPQFRDYTDNPTGAQVFEARQRFLVYGYDQRPWIGSNA